MSYTPLAVDLDGTLIRTDLLYESFFSVLKRHHFKVVFLCLFWLCRGRNVLKHELAERADVNPEQLPQNRAVHQFVQQARLDGRPVWLATAASEKLARSYGATFQFQDHVFSSDLTTNLSGSTKAKKLCDEFGEGAFDYIGDSFKDVPVWKASRKAIMVNPPSGLVRKVRAFKKEEDIIVLREGRPLLKSLVKLLRPHQYVKNALILLPLLLSHQWQQAESLILALIAFASFSMTASSVYVINDAFDVQSDRKHPQKRFRPIASGDISLTLAAALVVLLLGIGFTLGWVVSPMFVGILSIYLVTNLAYTLKLKQVIVLDVLLLSAFYTLRIFGGAVATQVEVSDWLLAFSTFFFFSLALMKRYAELRHTTEGDQVAGRGYHKSDEALVLAQGVGSGLISVMVFGLYIGGDQVKLLYTKPFWLWFISIALLYWICRMWSLAHRGIVKGDPVLTAIKTPESYLVLAWIVVFGLLAI